MKKNEVLKLHPPEPLPPLGETSDPNAVVVSEAALILTGLGSATRAGMLSEFDPDAEFGIAKNNLEHPKRRDDDIELEP